MVRRTQPVPFIRTCGHHGSGKTLILADVIEQIRDRLPIEPVVLWLSKGRVVVWQTYADLSTGKYSEFVEKPLLECKPGDVTNSGRGLLLIATVGKFNQRDKEKGDRKIFQTQLDAADRSLWEMSKARRDESGRRRQLIVVYDEGHNLSNQQTQLLMELDPDALIAASAATRVPQALSATIEPLRREKNWGDDDLVTGVPSGLVVAEGLVKKYVLLGGYMTPMESAINELLVAMREADQAAEDLGLPFRSKAIYISNTNAADGIAIKDDMARPFRERQARPILMWRLMWRHLVERAGIDPETIAVYNDLKFDKKFPPPPAFTLFSGGDTDYDRFTAGGYSHIIFNLGLQEGWDDPECAFAYIDKDMGSPDQVTQIVGRVLRQPGAQHYSASNLNTAHFYIRTDEKGVFEAILDDVERKLTAQNPEIAITVRRETHGGSKPYKEPLRPRQVPIVSVDSTHAREPIARIVEATHDYRRDDTNTVGKGGRIQVLQTIGEGRGAVEEWVEVAHSNRVTARWVIRREVQRLFSNHGDRERSPINLCDIEDPRFDALIEYNSRAAEHIREQARKIVEAYIEHSTIVQNALDHPYQIGSVLVDETKIMRFRNAVHEGYSDLNVELERPFAEALDKTRRVWCRNPSAGGFSIPLLDRGSTRTFRPDFLVWVDNQIMAIDTKGGHSLPRIPGESSFYRQDGGRARTDNPARHRGCLARRPNRCLRQS